jgi:hypothetical protein
MRSARRAARAAAGLAVLLLVAGAGLRCGKREDAAPPPVGAPATSVATEEAAPEEKLADEERDQVGQKAAAPAGPPAAPSPRAAALPELQKHEMPERIADGTEEEDTVRRHAPTRLREYNREVALETGVSRVFEQDVDKAKDGPAARRDPREAQLLQLLSDGEPAAGKVGAAGPRGRTSGAADDDTGLLDGKERSGKGEAEPEEPATGEEAEEEKRSPEKAEKKEDRRDEKKTGARSPAPPPGLPGRLTADVRPTSFLPRMFYFENTYLGGNAAHQERLRRLDAELGAGARPYRLAQLPPQGFDPPAEEGLALTAWLDRRSFDGPGRAVLQVGLKGSERYGWRRPPLDVVLIVDAPALAGGAEPPTEFVIELLRQLGPQDRLGVQVVGAPDPTLVPLSRTRGLHALLAPRLDTLRPPGSTADAALGTAMADAGAVLRTAAAEGGALPGTQTVLVLTRGASPARVAGAAAAAHDLTVSGIVTSVVELDAVSGEAGGLLWQVANAGYGNYHRVAPGDSPAAAVHAELDALSRVVARLLRLNVRLGKGAHAIRVLGSRVLDEEEARQVKAREVAADRQLSRTMGIQADRGEDDDGIQTVLPYFYGGDAHVVLIELWLDEPGAVAEVTLKYKDMVNLRNATAHAAVSLRAVPRPETPTELAIRRNVEGFALGAALERAGHRVRHGDDAGAHAWLAEAAGHASVTTEADRALVAELGGLARAAAASGDPTRRALAAEALVVAGRRRVGASETSPGE